MQLMFFLIKKVRSSYITVLLIEGHFLQNYLEIQGKMIIRNLEGIHGGKKKKVEQEELCVILLVKICNYVHGIGYTSQIIGQLRI